MQAILLSLFIAGVAVIATMLSTPVDKPGKLIPIRIRRDESQANRQRR
ncbi:hypothetical protein HZU77_012555 [Neisseriaceae bacterium TC5R-5]|nr:hypothetical protein [Neisseriaceae bacterium TC5R-5]